VAATKSYSAQLLTSYLLVATWANLKINGDMLIAQAEKLTSNASLVSEAVAACSRENETVVLGRGFAYPNAREAALKIQETCKVSVQGLSTADYLHGPISALTPQTQVFILAPAHLPLNSISEATTRIRAITGRIIWVGNGGSPEAGDIVIAGSDCHDEMESTIVDAISLQRFSLEFAKKSGFDPDAPVGLSKVTLTH
jgi:glucosamine--fructose-6-phosphate aminotransferase (isomerizing)